MSWSQRAGSAPPPPERAPFQPRHTGLHASQAQPYGNQQAMYPNYQGAPSPGNTQQQYWQQPPPQPQPQPQPQPNYNQQYGQAYQQDYGNNANQFYQQPQYNQNYSSPGYTTNQQGYQQTYYQNQSAQPTYPPTKQNSDGWEESWDWGWDESKQAQNAAAKNPAPVQVPPQQPVFNNANVLEESFASNNTWNWAMEDKKETKEPVPAPKQEPLTPAEHPPQQNNVLNEPPAQRPPVSAQQPSEEVRTLGDRDVVKERLPNLALGKRFHLDNLTPQWSIESQMSQESSDGPLTHSEGTYRSENQSRNSNKSSPGLNTDNSNFNYSQSGLDEYPPSSEWSKHSNDDSTLVDNVQNSSRRESHDELSSSMQEMSIANRENLAPDMAHINKDTRNLRENLLANMPPPSISPANLPPPVSSMLPLPPSLSANMPPAPPASSASLPPPSSSPAVLPPPSNFPPTSSNTNPFKQSGPFSHKKVHSVSPSIQPFPQSISSTNLTSPAAVNKISQHRVPVGFGANLETTPDNSERPDQPHMSAFRPLPVAPQVPDNLEVAPQNDRNEYLQTAHLSGGDYGENTDFSRNVPSPGLRRMVVGQQESEYGQNLNMSGDEPPPGLARMVPGQQTEADNSYNQPGDNYMDRHIDGQTTDGGRPYRRADGQVTPDNYSQPPPGRGQDRRPVGRDRRVPGERSNDEYPQYQGSSYAGVNEQRVVMGVDHDYPMPADAGPSDIREQNVDGSDYSEQTPRNPPRNVLGAREASNDVTQDFPPADEQQREVIMEGENLQDLSIISSADLTFSRDQTLDGADVNTTDIGTDRKTDVSDSMDHVATSSRRQSLNRVNSSGDESDRDRAFKSSPRRDRDKHKSSRDRDRDRDRNKEGRYSRGERTYDRESERRVGRGDRRGERDRRDRDRDRRERDESPDARRHRRSARSGRYETEDTDYYSDRERERRRYREGSYASKPPRPEDKERERERSRRYNTIERDRRYEEERDGTRRERHGRYRDIDPGRTLGNLRRERDDERRRGAGETYSSPSRPGSREAPATDEELADPAARRRDRRTRRRDRDRERERDPYYEASYGAGAYSDPYEMQRQQYQYYEHLRRTDPAAYMVVYKQLMAGRAPPAPPAASYQLYREGYGSLGYEAERGSVHSGRSSTNGLKGNDTDLNTDASLNLHLDESTVRSERMTPFKFSTAHVKGSISSRHVVVVRPSYPVDGMPATVHIVSLSAALAGDPLAAELQGYPGPLVKGVTHKKSVMDYCASRVRGATSAGGRDAVGYVLLWELLALLLRQNGVVVGADIAELLMKNKTEYEYKTSPSKNTAHNDSRRGSSQSGRDEDPRAWSPEQPSASISDLTPQEEPSSPQQSPAEERAALEKLRDHLTYGNRQDALEWAMSSNQWGHALALSAYCERRVRGAVAARFLAALPRNDPLHTLYSHLQAKQPPAATCVADERWGDWRPHAAIMLSNNSAKPDQDRRTLTQLGDSLSSRGLLYSAQFCYLSAGVQLSRHPLAPLQPPTTAPQTCPRLALLLADPRATSLHQLATNQAIFATEIYEYALSLSQDHVINELQVYKLILACRLVDCGLYERALSYTEQAARAVTRAPREFSPAFVTQLCELADRLKYHEPALHEDPPLIDEGGESAEPSPRHQQWLEDVTSLAQALTAEATQASPQHQQQQQLQQQQQQLEPQYYAQPPAAPYGWGEQIQQQYQPPPPPTFEPEETPDYSQYYQQQQQQSEQQQQADQQQQQQQYGYEEQHQSYAEPYAWTGDATGGYGEAGAGAGAGAGEPARPQITMPGATTSKPGLYAEYDDDRPPSADQTDRETDSPKSGKKADKAKDESKGEGKGKGGSGGGSASGGGWLGGILTKLSLRAPNQMILPDDKNPTIVWDAEHKRWRNLDGDEDQASAAPPPPPRTADLALPPHAPHQNASPLTPTGTGASGAPPAAPMSNIFKMQKGRHIKKSYVDVFNPSGAPTRPLPPPSEVLGPPPPANTAPTAYFVPGAARGDETGVYSPAQAQAAGAEYRSGI